MIIKKIKIKNWMAFKGEFGLVVPHGSISVVAKYDDNPRRSNWAGKTAFLEAVEWCLFGVHRKRYEDSVIFYGEEDVQVKIEFSTGLIVDRYRRRSQSTKLLVGIKKDAGGMQWSEKKYAQKLIEKTLGFNHFDYRATVCFSQGDIESIVNRTSGDRRKIISQWLELDGWLRLAARARQALKQDLEKLNGLKRKAEIVSDRIFLFAREICEISDDDSEKIIDWIYTDKPFIFATREEYLQSLVYASEAELGEIRKVFEIYDDIEVCRRAFEKRDLLIEEGRRLKFELTGVRLEDCKNNKIELENLICKKEKISREHGEITRLYTSGFDGICPVMKKNCVDPDCVKLEVKNIEGEYLKIKNEYETICNDLEKCRDEIDKCDRREKEILAKRERFKFIIREIFDLEALSKKWLESGKGCFEKFERLKSREKELINKIASINADLRNIDDRISGALKYREEIKEISGEIKEIEEKIKILNLVVQATSQSGIPAFLTGEILYTLENRANFLLRESGLSFTFSMDRDTRDLEMVCGDCGYIYRSKRKDKNCLACGKEREIKKSDDLEILVNDGSGAVEDVRVKSGGAKVLIATAIRLTAGLMLRELRNSPCAFAQVDELMGALDSENREKMAGIFSGMLDSVGLAQCFVVSHDSKFLDSLPGRILITKFSDYSSIAVDNN